MLNLFSIKFLNFRNTTFLLILFILFFNISCKSKDNTATENLSANVTSSNTGNIKHFNQIKKYYLDIIDTIPHNVNYYTQGFVWHNGFLYEGTGQEGLSALVKYNKNYSVDKFINLETQYFGEGVTILSDKIYQITWLDQKCFVYDLKNLKKIKELSYSGEGWGLTNNDSLLIMSDGSADIRFINPENFTIVSNLRVKRNGNPVRFLNELELVDTLLYANIYMYDLIIIANINTGEVVGEVDISPLRKMLYNNPQKEVSNGIAYNKKEDYFYLTGKYWNKIFVVRFVAIN